MYITNPGKTTKFLKYVCQTGSKIELYQVLKTRESRKKKREQEIKTEKDVCTSARVPKL